ncbi:carboxylesterase family protein [Paraburkholderia sediminicola]|uniref:carboxylesterase family protein n=1 Tax=Paraburkholderia sediminicola TaxID=458836 RepID=UPI0038BE0AFB
MEHTSNRRTFVTETLSGKIRGVLADGIEAYLGVPYGAAVGDLGPFAEVSPVPDWAGILDCTDTPAVFPQAHTRLSAVLGPAIDEHPQSDQAFSVNIFAPHGAKGLPVLVFVHGGAFCTGGGTRWYDGSRLARSGNIVVVTVNYRLGIWGNIAAPGAPTNNAVRDVLAALHWIAANIGTFGGDAGNVTLSGQSAGAALTRLLTLCSDAEGLFKRAIILSCPGHIGATHAEMADVTNRVMELADASDVVALAGKTPDRLLDAVMTVTRDRTVQGSVMPLFRPYTDGVLLQDWMDDPQTSAGRAHCREIVIGLTREEFAPFFWEQADAINSAPETVLGWYQHVHGERAATAYRQAALHRPRATPYTQWIDGMQDQTFGQPTLALAGAYAERRRAFVYRFDLQSRQPHLYAAHCIDLPFFFDNLSGWFDAPMLHGFEPGALQPLASRFSTCMANFVRTGDPGIDGWPPFTEASPYLMPFDND